MIQVRKFRNAVEYKVDSRRVMIRLISRNLVSVYTRELLELTEKQKKEYTETETSFLVSRSHSKYCVWHNISNFSVEAIHCIFDFQNHIKDLIVTEDD